MTACFALPVVDPNITSSCILIKGKKQMQATWNHWYWQPSFKKRGTSNWITGMGFYTGNATKRLPNNLSFAILPAENCLSFPSPLLLTVSFLRETNHSFRFISDLARKHGCLQKLYNCNHLKLTLSNIWNYWKKCDLT